MEGVTYQIGLFGAGIRPFGAQIEAAVRARVTEIGDDLAEALSFFGPGEQPSARWPSVIVYVGGDTVTDEEDIEAMIAASIPVVPVVFDLEHYSSQVPPALKPINGSAVDAAAPDFAAIVNVVLENLGLLRKARRLFLSYRRVESTPVAQQLRIAFDAQGYDAFLDTNSVPKGDPFQDVLWHRLLDSDVVVVLATENFLASKYTKLEIANASAMAVGMLQVLWPGVQSEPFASLAVPFQLEDADFDGEQLKTETIVRIVSATERLRARCLAARHASLIGEFCEEVRRIGGNPLVQPGRFVLAEMPDGRRIAAIPAVGVPDAQRYHEASSRFPVGEHGATEARLIYDHRGMLPQWMSFLDWLDDFLPVKGLRVTDTAAKLGRA